MNVSVRFTVLASMIAGGLLAADLPYAGKWKLNPSKSDFGETTFTYEQMPGGEMKVTMDNQSYTFKTDGKDYPTPWGTTTAVKAVDANTWETIDRADGKVTATSTEKLSADGKTLTVDVKRMKADGGTSSESMVLQRVSGGPGLAGKWKTKNVKISSPGTVNITASGPDGLKIAYVEENGTCDARFDGKDHAAKGPMWPSGWTCVIAKSGANGLDVTWKKDGKPMYKSMFTVSSDGKTMTESGGAAGGTEKTKAVYDRQAQSM